MAKMTADTIAIGTRVRYRATFLRAIGCYSGQVCQATGTVQGLVPLGTRGRAQVAWDSPGAPPSRVLTANLWPVGRPEPT